MIFRFLVILSFLSFFGCRAIIVPDYTHHNQYEDRHDKKDCKHDCKGLKGKDRANCNKYCND